MRWTFVGSTRRRVLVEGGGGERGRTNSLEEGRSVHLRNTLISHSHETVHRIVSPIRR